MASRYIACAGAFGLGMLAGCSSPFDQASSRPLGLDKVLPAGVTRIPDSAYRDRREDGSTNQPNDQTNDQSQTEAVGLDESTTLDGYVRYALLHSPAVEAAYQRWRVAAEQLPQARALPDPRLSLGFFLDEVETRTGAQQARVGVQQAFPWPGTLDARERAAGRAAMAAYRRFEAQRLVAAERVVAALYDLASLDSTIEITRENLGLLASFEEVLRARYRVGAGSHPELIRVQVELGELEDRLAQLRATRPALTAALNTALHRPATTNIPTIADLPAAVADLDAPGLVAIALHANPQLLAQDERIARERVGQELARLDGMPDLTIGVDTILTNNAGDSSIAESGDDPIMLSLGLTLPIWRERSDAQERGALAQRLAATHDRAVLVDRITSGIHRAWFEHTDADRRVQLLERTLIPKAEESLRASLAGFRAGETSFLDLLDTERTLLNFAIQVERARADRGKALARLITLTGRPVPTRPANDIESTTGERP